MLSTCAGLLCEPNSICVRGRAGGCNPACQCTRVADHVMQAMRNGCASDHLCNAECLNGGVPERVGIIKTPLVHASLRRHRSEGSRLRVARAHAARAPACQLDGRPT
eukprot:1985400-Lingulodinium_polyedra.AAC.1